jgi:thiol-disulfide isomerase/thioredoxin
MERSDAAFALLICAGLLVLSLVLFRRCSSPPKPLGPAPEEGIASLLQAPSKTLGSLRELRGRAVVLEFWATWCGVCRDTLPHMNKLRARFQNRPVVFISVTREGRAKVEPYLKDNPTTGWIGLDEDGRLHRALGVTGIPQVVIIDPQGLIRLKVSPSFLYETDIARALLAAPESRPSASQ